MTKLKTLFMKFCTVIVIFYLFFPSLIQARKETQLLYEKLVTFLRNMIKGNEIVMAVCSIVICLLGFWLILWIWKDDEEKGIINKIKKEV